MNWTQQQDFMRSMPAVAAKILIMMLWANRSLTNQEWCQAVDATDKTVKASLDWLAERGLAQDNGRLEGWSLPNQLPLPFKQLWQGHSGVYLPDSFVSPTSGNDTESKVTAPELSTGGGEGVEKEIGISDLFPPLINCLINTLDQEKELINQSINQIGEFGNSDLLRQVMATTTPPIVSPTADELVRCGVDAASLLAWYWWSIQQKWVDLPVGYAINRVRRAEAAPAAHLELARCWLDLDEDGRLDFNSIFYNGSPYTALASLRGEFELSQSAAALATQLRPLGVFDDDQ